MMWFHVSSIQNLYCRDASHLTRISWMLTKFPEDRKCPLNSFVLWGEAEKKWLKSGNTESLVYWELWNIHLTHFEIEYSTYMTSYCVRIFQRREKVHHTTGILCFNFSTGCSSVNELEEKLWYYCYKIL